MGAFIIDVLKELFFDRLMRICADNISSAAERLKRKKDISISGHEASGKHFVDISITETKDTKGKSRIFNDITIDNVIKQAFKDEKITIANTKITHVIKEGHETYGVELGHQEPMPDRPDLKHLRSDVLAEFRKCSVSLLYSGDEKGQVDELQDVLYKYHAATTRRERKKAWNEMKDVLDIIGENRLGEYISHDTNRDLAANIKNVIEKEMQRSGEDIHGRHHGLNLRRFFSHAFSHEHIDEEYKYYEMVSNAESHQRSGMVITK